MIENEDKLLNKNLGRISKFSIFIFL